MNNIIKKVFDQKNHIAIRILSALAIALLVLCGYSKYAYADSTVVHTFAAGDPVFITSEDDDWYIGYYKSQYIYIYKYATVTDAAGDATTLLSASEAVDKDALSNEFKNAETQEKQALEDYEHQQVQKRNKYIWIAVIVTIAAALVIISVLKALKKYPDNE